MRIHQLFILGIIFLLFNSIRINAQDDTKVNDFETDQSSYSFLFESCSALEIHPNADDFRNDSGQLDPNTHNLGKVLIWSRDDDNAYHTPYQTQDGVVRIVAKFPSNFPNNKVYFRVRDIDDQSPYETNTNEDDNFDKINLTEVGLISSIDDIEDGTEIISASVSSNGVVKIATVYLRITDRHSGDNYEVDASFDENFTEVVSTTNLIAWKRSYVDSRDMYESGSFLASVANSNEDMIFVNNYNDIRAGDDIIIFDNNNNNFTTSVTNVQLVSSTGVLSPSTGFDRINISPSIPANINFQTFTGIRKVSNLIKSTSTNQSIVELLKIRLQDGFGKFGNGDDSSFDIENSNPPSGGVFMEFKFYENGITLPRFKKSPLTTNDLLALYLIFWKGYLSNQKSTFLNVISFEFNSGGISGKGFDSSNVQAIFTDNIDPNGNSGDNSMNLITNSCVHEFGHQFGLEPFQNVNMHIETFLGATSNDLNIECVMGSYGTHHEESNAEFDTHHNVVPTASSANQTCIGDIRGGLWPEGN